MPDQSSGEAPLDANFVEVIDVLNARNIPYWVCHGTLLGLIRDGTLIPWDHDIDIAMWAGTVSKTSLIELMLSKGYRLKSDGSDYDFVQFTKGPAREVDFNFYRLSPGSDMAYSEWFIPRSIVTKVLARISNASIDHGKWSKIVRTLSFLSPPVRRIMGFLKTSGVLYKSAGYTTPAELLQEFETLNVSGVGVRVPRLGEAVLDYVYGADWRVPKQEYDWTKESPATVISKARF